MTDETKNTPSPEKDFSGNYIEKFDRQVNSEEFYPGNITACQQTDAYTILFSGEGVSLEVKVLTPTMLRFRFAIDGYFEDDFSYAINPDFNPPPVPFSVTETEEGYLIATEELKCKLARYSFLTTITNKQGQVILADEKGFHWRKEKRYGGNIVIQTKQCNPQESYYGLGDKSCRLNLLHKRLKMWGTDCYGYTENTDPVYKNIPFYQGLNQELGYGVFLDNSFRTFFDFAAERPDATSFWAMGGEMRYYFVYGPELSEVTRQYALLTGMHPMPPKWALGYQQSKWSYYPESTVRQLADTFRKLQIPCDVIHLDIDYMDGYRCFTWDKDRFPDPKKMIQDLRNQGFKIVVIVDPGIKVDKEYFVYKQGVEGGHFCVRADGPLMTGSVWPGLCHFPDFTNPKAREWWSELFYGLAEDGVKGIWNDMNEPAVFETGTFPLDVRHDYDGHPCSHRKGHNVYGMQMARATNMGQQKSLPKHRPLTISRSGYAGMQRYTAVWTGDNVASWEHLKIANVQMQRLSVSGISFAGSDVGGFIGTPDAELYVRWIQLAVFHPFFRTHSSGDHGDKEPWVYDEATTDLVRKFIELRYKLLPYLYTAFWQHSSQGEPFLKPLYMIDQQDKETHFREDEFLVGDHILACPVLHAQATERTLYVPQGNWYNYWNNDLLQGPAEVQLACPLNQVPMLIRAGAVVALQPKMQYVDEFLPDQLELNIYYGVQNCRSVLYEDAGDGYEYLQGEYGLRRFVTYTQKQIFTIEQHREGQYEAGYKQFSIQIHGLPYTPVNISIDGQQQAIEAIQPNGVLMVTLPTNFNKVEVY